MIGFAKLAKTRWALAAVLLASGPTLADYSDHQKAEAFIATMVDKHQFTREQVTGLLQQAEKKQAILDAIERPAEKTKQWDEYQDIFLDQNRVRQGVQFWRENQATIARAAEEFGVAPEIIVAIIGVETRYGRQAGGYRVIDALATLGFDYPPRAEFFIGQLEQFLLLAREQQQDPLSLTGSYAGAMGYGQFIPSSYRSFAVDFDGDGVADIWHNPVDAIGSVANYFKQHHWRAGEPVLMRAHIAAGYDKQSLNAKTPPALSLREIQARGFTPVEKGLDQQLPALPLMYQGKHGKEFWLGFHNFYVITRYNRSHLYAMAVWQLSQKIKANLG